MKALLLKELHGVGPLTLGHLVLASATWIGFVHYRGVVIEPDPTTAFGILGAGSIFGALLGFSQFARERWQGTQAFLIHRESSVRDAFFAKITVGLVATYAMTWVPILAYFLFGQAFRGWGGMAQSSRLFELAWIAFGALGGYATGVLASQMRVGTVRGLLTAFAGGLGAMSIAWIGPFAAVYSV